MYSRSRFTRKRLFIFSAVLVLLIGALLVYVKYIRNDESSGISATYPAGWKAEDYEGSFRAVGETASGTEVDPNLYIRQTAYSSAGNRSFAQYKAYVIQGVKTNKPDTEIKDVTVNGKPAFQFDVTNENYLHTNKPLKIRYVGIDYGDRAISVTMSLLSDDEKYLRELSGILQSIEAK